jgi:drug/metabolite transporter (DMT)-like permease
MITRERLDLKRLVTDLRVPFLKVLLSRSIIGQIMIVYGFTMTTAFKGILLLRIEPLFVYLWTLYYRREQPTAKKIALLLALIGGSVLAVLPSGTIESAALCASTNGATNTGLASTVVASSAPANGAILAQVGATGAAHIAVAAPVVAHAAGSAFGTTAHGALVAALARAPIIVNSGPCLGDVLVVCSLLFISFSYDPTREIVQAASPAGLNLLLNFLGGLIVAVAVFIMQPQQFAIGAQTLGVIAAYSVVFFILAASLYFEAFRTLKPWVISSFLSLEVVFGLVISVLLLHQSFTALQLVGCAIVVAVTIAIGRVGD